LLSVVVYFCLRHSYALYLAEFSSLEEAIKIFEQAIGAMKENLLINFIYAEFLESHNKIAVISFSLL